MDGNHLLSLGAPRADWTKTPGRVPGFWVALLGLVIAVVFPIPGLLVGAVGFLFTLQAYRAIPAGATGRRLVLAALAIGAATVAVVLLQTVLAVAL